MEMGVESAYRRSIETVVDWIRSELNTSRTQVFFRTFAPVHFRFVSLLKRFFFPPLIFSFLFG